MVSAAVLGQRPSEPRRPRAASFGRRSKLVVPDHSAGFGRQELSFHTVCRSRGSTARAPSADYKSSVRAQSSRPPSTTLDMSSLNINEAAKCLQLRLSVKDALLSAKLATLLEFPFENIRLPVILRP